MFILLSTLVQCGYAATFYVATNGNDLAAGTNWLTARKSIQAAIDLASSGDVVRVSNGVYSTGGRVANGALTNRIAITNAISVLSENGPEVTIITGSGPNGSKAVRCAYVGTNAFLSGFTLTNGYTASFGDLTKDMSGGGVWCDGNAVVSNCIISGNTAARSGAGSVGGLLRNCTLSGNTADYDGGGAYLGVLDQCTIANNSTVRHGGGANSCELNFCVLTGNSANSFNGGGAYSCSLNDCTVSGNSANSGGGAFGSTLQNCTLSENSAFDTGGGTVDSTLLYCTLTGNTAENNGGGAWGGDLATCVVVGNSAGNSGGGAFISDMNNCIIIGNSAATGGGVYEDSLIFSVTVNNSILFYNTAINGANYYDSHGAALTYCCTTPLPPGPGNMTNEPALASLSHLSTNSPCIGAGNFTNAAGTDIDGENWLNPPSIGCDEVQIGSITGSLVVGIWVSYTNVMPNYTIEFRPDISGRVSKSIWNFGDGTATTNRPFMSHTYAATGIYPVVLTAFNETFPGGVSATVNVVVVDQPVYYVNVSNSSPALPYTSWSNAATDIQTAIDYAYTPGSLVLVTNGVYATGGRVVYGQMTNRVVINKPIIVRSVNGPSVTFIAGAADPSTTLGDKAVRCVYVKSNAFFSGFTLTNGHTRSSGNTVRENYGGGIWCDRTAVVSNCIITGNSAVHGGGSYNGVLNNCILANNSAVSGGGSMSGTLYRCTFAGNSATSGGGSRDSTLMECTLSNNVSTASAGYGGGGTYGGVINNCVISGNLASNYGGGACLGFLYNCTLSGNVALGDGGGAYQSTLRNSIVEGNVSGGSGGGANSCSVSNSALIGNSAAVSGGGSYIGTLRNSTLSGNSAPIGGGAFNGTLNNCIVYFNAAATASNYSGSTFTYSCTAPLPSGTGNVSGDPALASTYHLSTSSICIGAGNASFAVGSDIDGESWSSPPSKGCDEIHIGSITGMISAGIRASYTNVMPGFLIDFTAQITGRLVRSIWDFGDGTLTSNRPYISHAFAAPGEYPVVLTAINETFPSGVSATVRVVVVEQPVHFVALSNATPVAPYSTWATAAANIQDAVDAAVVPGALVLVSNGVYNSGGRQVVGLLTNRIAITQPVTVRSVNGPAVTFIVGATPNGNSAVRCAYVGANASLAGFTLTNGHTRTSGDTLTERSGGAVWCESSATLSNCILAGNGASYNGGGAFGGSLYRCILNGNTAGNFGGGVCTSILQNCLLTGNSATLNGGGAYYCALRNCTVTKNSVSVGAGGGTYNGTMTNCIVYFNTASSSSNYLGSTFSFSCTAPLPAGSGNISSNPLFIATNNFRVTAISPCVNKGTNLAWMTDATDLDGNPRIANAVVDMGAFEYQTPSGYWLWAAGITNTLTNITDSASGDGFPNLLKYVTGSSPTNPDALALMDGLFATNLNRYALQFMRNTSAVDATLIVEGSYEAANTSSWIGIATNINGSWGGATNVVETGSGSPVTSFVQDTIAVATNRFLRLRVTLP